MQKIENKNIILEKRGIIPRKIKGFRDIDESLNKLRWQVIDSASSVYQLYGFEHLDTPLLEYADCLGKYLPDIDTVDEGVYSFKNPEQEPILDKQGMELRDKWDQVIMENHYLSLRYDLTAPLARYYAERFWNSYLLGHLKEGKSELFRRYQFGPVFRFEKKMEAGRFREFWQLDFDTIGSKNISSDAEVCMVLADAMEAIGLKRNTYLVHVNNRKILSGFLQSLGIKNIITENSILRILDKVDKIGLDGMIQELGEERIDKISGSKVIGLKLNKNNSINFNKLIDSLMLFYEKFESLVNRKEIINRLKSYIDMNNVYNEGVTELEKIDILLNNLNFVEDRVRFSPTLIRGMTYYTGPVFEVESLQPYIDEKGKEQKFGSLCGGGRYDGLVQRLLGISVPATGASIGVDRICELLRVEELKDALRGPVLIVNFDDDLMIQYQKIAEELRIVGISSEVYLGDQKGLKKQLAYADKRNSPLVILIGSDEIANGVATIKDLKLGEEMKNIKDKDEWKKLSQRNVKLDKLVDTVTSMI